MNPAMSRSLELMSASRLFTLGLVLACTVQYTNFAHNPLWPTTDVR